MQCHTPTSVTGLVLSQGIVLGSLAVVAYIPRCSTKITRHAKEGDQALSMYPPRFQSVTVHRPSTLEISNTSEPENMASLSDAQEHVDRLRSELDPPCHPRFASLMTNALDLFVSPHDSSYKLEADSILGPELSVNCMTDRLTSFMNFYRTWMIPHTQIR